MGEAQAALICLAGALLFKRSAQLFALLALSLIALEAFLFFFGLEYFYEFRLLVWVAMLVVYMKVPRADYAQVLIILGAIYLFTALAIEDYLHAKGFELSIIYDNFEGLANGLLALHLVIAIFDSLAGVQIGNDDNINNFRNLERL